MVSPPPVKTSDFIKFLEHKGCIEGKGTKHNKWKCPGCLRSIMFDRSKKDIPYLHVHSTIKNMGITMSIFKEWVKENC